MILTALERDELKERENRIRRGLSTFIQVAEDLWVIRTKKLYRESHKSFEAYVVETFGMSRQHGNRMVKAFEVVTNVTPVGVAPTNERQTRSLGAFTPETQRAIWATACEETNGKPTDTAVDDVVDRLASKAWGDMPDKDKKALAKRTKDKVTDEESRLKRQERMQKALRLLVRAAKELKGCGVNGLVRAIQRVSGSLEKAMAVPT